MGRSSDGLVDRLLDEIALCGDLGCSPSYVASILFDLCLSYRTTNDYCNDDSEPLSSEPRFESLQSQVWTQTLQHPDLYIDKFPNTESWLNSSETSKIISAPGTDPGGASKNLHQQLPGLTPTSRIYACIDRAFRAICGHAKDFSRVPGELFNFLSVIASYGAHGVPLTTLEKTLPLGHSETDRMLDRLISNGYVVVVDDVNMNGRKALLTRFKIDTTPGSSGKPENASTTSMEAAAISPPGRVSSLSSAAIHTVSPSTQAYLVSNNSATPMQRPRNWPASQGSNGKRAQMDEQVATEEYMTTRSKRAKPPPSDRELLMDSRATAEERLATPFTNLPPPTNDPKQVAEIPLLSKEEQEEQNTGENRGRPRKFVRGTEDFWREMCAEARKLANPGKKLVVKGGLMTDPVAVALFTGRPAAFDRTLLRAVERGLPIPATPQEISQEWVDKTRRLVDRPPPGASISPRGHHPNGWVKSKPTSQVLIVCTPRLRELSLSNLHKVAEVRFFTSSAAHTLHYRRYYPTMPTREPAYYNASVQAELEGRSKLSLTTSRSDDARKRTEQQAVFSALEDNARLDSRKPPPNTIIDYLPSSPSLMQLLMAEKRKSVFSAIVSRPNKRRKRVFEFWEPVAPIPKQPLDMVSTDTEPDSRKIQANPFGLPPPMKTRRAVRIENNPNGTPAPISRGGTMQTNATLTGIEAEMAVNEALERLDPRLTPASGSSDNGGYMLESGAAEHGQSGSFFSSGLLDDRSERRERQRLIVKEGPRGGGQLSYVRRKLLMEMVDRCSGAMPNNTTCPAAVFMESARIARLEGWSDCQAMKRAIKSLIDSGHLKLIRFSFKSKRGTMVTRAIYARLAIQANHHVVQRLQREIIQAEPSDYVPPELSAIVSASEQLVIPITSNTNAIPEWTGDSVVPPERRSNGKNVTGRPAWSRGEAIIWGRPDDRQPLPQSLAEMLRDNQTSNTTTETEKANIESEFYSSIEKCLQWELRKYDACIADPSHTGFINFFASNSQPMSVANHDLRVKFIPSIWYNESGSEVPYPFAETPLPKLLAKVRGHLGARMIYTELGDTEASDVSSYEPEESDRDCRPTKRRKLDDSVTPITDLYLEGRQPRQTRRARRKRGPFSIPSEPRKKRDVLRKPTPLGLITTPDGSTIPIKRQRGLQHLRALKEDDVYRIAVTIIVIRTLTGGLEKFTDWTLIMKLFPNEDEQWVKDRWKTIANRYRKDVQNLTESFQDRYVAALARGEAPSVNFNDLDLPDPQIGATGTNWHAIVEWAVANLDRFNVQELDELPGTREQLCAEKNLAFEEHKGLRDVLGYNIIVANPKKQEQMAGIVWGINLSSIPNLASSTSNPSYLGLTYAAEVEELQNPTLTLARSWCLATVLTRSDYWDVRAMRQKLLTLASTEVEIETLIDSALRTLQRDKIIAKNRDLRMRATLLEGGWEASLKFWEHWNFRRMITTDMLREAVKYKTEVLDKALDEQGLRQITLNKESVVTDGQMVAVLNLAAAGRLCIRPGLDVPRGRYGLDWQEKGYQTRLLDKKTLAFSIDVVPGFKKYATGTDVLHEPSLPPRTSVPRGEMDAAPEHGTSKGMIPMWFDILGHFNSEIWEMVVAAVVGLISTRAGLDALEIRRTLNWAISGWELDLVIEWLLQAGYIQKTASGNGWTTCEWWWLVLAAGCHGEGRWDADHGVRGDRDENLTQT